jgi:curli production assembly/transport component CsgG
MKIIALSLIILLSGCAVIQKSGFEYKPEVTANKLQKEFDEIPAPDGKKVTVAVYSFKDLTGQRKPTPGVASFSTAVTQGAEALLIRALQDVGNAKWFDVVERTNVDNLTKERTIIRQMREAYEGPNSKPLMPLQFAGLILEGGIIGYDSGNESGGAAHRFLGIGTQTQYSKDIVTVSLRAVSVNTGKVLVAVTVQKVVYSTADAVAVLKFIQNGTQAFEAETGLTINEAGTLAVKATIEAAVVEMIKEGERRGVWDYKKETIVMPMIQAPEVAPVLAPQPVVEVKKEEPKIVQTNSIPVVRPEPKVEEKRPEVKVSKYILNKNEYVRKEPDSKTLMWFFPKDTEVVISSPVDSISEWVEIKDKNGRKGFTKRENLKETN